MMASTPPAETAGQTNQVIPEAGGDRETIARIETKPEARDVEGG
jgi:hypothetical protein